MTHFILKTFLTGDFEQLIKLKPSSEFLGGLAAAKIKPLAEFSGKESLAYALINRLPFYHGECLYRDERFIYVGLRSFQDRLEEENPGIRLSLLRRFNRFIGSLPSKTVSTGNIRRCIVCGMISQTEKCAFCKLMEKALGDAEALNRKIKEKILTFAGLNLSLKRGGKLS
jgi:uncharacterized protein (TIGR00269 family)